MQEARTEMITAIESVADPLLKHRRVLRTTLSGIASPVPEPEKDTDQRPGNIYNATNFDTNVVIIMAALLCVLICALGINSVVRCAIRCTRRLAVESPEEVAARLANTGMKKNAVKALPTVVYGKAVSGAQTGWTECPICLGEFADGENMRVLPKCNHGFHVKCIDTWLVSHSSCPTCRHSLLSIAEQRPRAQTVEILSTPVGAGQPASWRMQQEPPSQCVETRTYTFPPPEHAGGVVIREGGKLPSVGPADEGCSSMFAAADDQQKGMSPAKEGGLAAAGTSP